MRPQKMYVPESLERTAYKSFWSREECRGDETEGGRWLDPSTNWRTNWRCQRLALLGAASHWIASSYTNSQYSTEAKLPQPKLEPNIFPWRECVCVCVCGVCVCVCGVCVWCVCMCCACVRAWICLWEWDDYFTCRLWESRWCYRHPSRPP